MKGGAHTQTVVLPTVSSRMATICQRAVRESRQLRRKEAKPQQPPSVSRMVSGTARRVLEAMKKLSRGAANASGVWRIALGRLAFFPAQQRGSRI